MGNIKPKKAAYILLRITMGINLLAHGLVRIPKLGDFRQWMMTEFEQSILPPDLVFAWATILPFLEFTIGLFLLAGLFTYRASIAGAIIIVILIFGSCLIENWGAVGTQMIYALFFYFLISRVNDNALAADNLIQNKSN